jgi:hypothetical protein
MNVPANRVDVHMNVYANRVDVYMNPPRQPCGRTYEHPRQRCGRAYEPATCRWLARRDNKWHPYTSVIVGMDRVKGVFRVYDHVVM